MRRIYLVVVALCFASGLAAQDAKHVIFSSLPVQQAANPSTPIAADPAEQKIVTAYTLPPELAKKAHDRGTLRFRLQLISFGYGIVVLLLILRWRLAAKYRDWAEKFSSRRFLQGMMYSPPLLLTVAVFTLPVDIYDNWMERKFGISIQSWGSWAGDWVKAQLIGIIIGTIFIWLLYAVIRRSTRRWWFYFWLFSLPIVLALIFLQPLVIDPLFHKFEPLQQKDPGLTTSLQQMVSRAGQDIPPERMFWMGAGEKTTALNAYVTGVGASKRIVVWDTTIAKLNTQQIVLVAGHEMGHYVLWHIPKLIVFSALFLLVIFYLGFRSVGGILSRRGTTWGIRSLEDWASLPVLMILLSVFSFAASPIISAVTRHYEHQADQYGLEVVHGLIPDSGQVAARAFQVLGEVDLADPDPSPMAVFLFYSHPPISERVQFSLNYDPWAKGETPQFVK